MNSNGLKTLIEERTFLSLNTHYEAKLENGQKVKLNRESIFNDPLFPGKEVSLSVKKEKINIYHGEIEENLSAKTEEKEVKANS